jgi:ribose transport system substrate-binding protein
MRLPGTSFVGSVGYFPEDYGEAVISLGMSIMHDETTPSAVFVKHQIITPQNVDSLYPNDSLVGMSDADLLLFSSR